MIASVVGRYVPPGASDIQLANVAFRRGRPPPAAIRVLRCGTRVILDPSDWPQAEAWVLGRYDIPSVQFIVDRLPEHGGVFFDVGGHVGLISCQVAARRTGVMIHGFEPHPRVAPMYKRNTALNAVSAVLTEAAASSSEGSVVFNLDSHAIGRGDVTSPTSVWTITSNPTRSSAST